MDDKFDFTLVAMVDHLPGGDHLLGETRYKISDGSTCVLQVFPKILEFDLALT